MLAGRAGANAHVGRRLQDFTSEGGEGEVNQGATIKEAFDDAVTAYQAAAEAQPAAAALPLYNCACIACLRGDEGAGKAFLERAVRSALSCRSGEEELAISAADLGTDDELAVLRGQGWFRELRRALRRAEGGGER